LPDLGYDANHTTFIIRPNKSECGFYSEAQLLYVTEALQGHTQIELRLGIIMHSEKLRRYGIDRLSKSRSITMQVQRAGSGISACGQRSLF
jgi:hypothetical protein